MRNRGALLDFPLLPVICRLDVSRNLHHYSGIVGILFLRVATVREYFCASEKREMP